jgi:hypothetical protein
MSNIPIIEYIETLARSSDPLPSDLAAKKVRIRIGDLHHEFMDALRKLGQATSNEVAASVSSDYSRINSLRRRASDLVQEGLIRNVGRRTCTVTGNSATVYQCVYPGERDA